VRKLFNSNASTIPIPGKISRQYHDSRSSRSFRPRLAIHTPHYQVLRF
jgi:hypothetical protein